MTTPASKTFLITGVSTGLGRAIAEEALAAGHRVVGTLRQPEQVAEFEAIAPGRAIARILDVTDDDAVVEVYGEIEKNVGPVDVLICNAGYGVEGTVEESSMADLRRQFDVNVFGAVATIKAALPFMRGRRAGHIFVITSMGGIRTFPGLAYYHGSKFAMEGIAESLGKEVAPFGIHVTAVAPGSFRTEWAGRSLTRSPRTISDYDASFGPVRAARERANGNQLGNPHKAGQAILTVVNSDNPPAHLVLGSDALRLIAEGKKAFDADMEAWEELSRSTDFPEGAQL